MEPGSVRKMLEPATGKAEAGRGGSVRMCPEQRSILSWPVSGICCQSDRNDGKTWTLYANASAACWR